MCLAGKLACNGASFDAHCVGAVLAAALWVIVLERWDVIWPAVDDAASGVVHKAALLHAQAPIHDRIGGAAACRAAAGRHSAARADAVPHAV